MRRMRLFLWPTIGNSTSRPARRLLSHNVLEMRVLMIAALCAAFSCPALAQQPPCSKRDDVVSHFAKKYGETPRSIGLGNNGGVVEVLTTPTGSTWTVIITYPNGMACMVAAGENWEQVPEIAPPEHGHY